MNLHGEITDSTGQRQSPVVLTGSLAQLDAGEASRIALNLPVAQVAAYERRGDDLYLTLVNGEVIRLIDFFDEEDKEPELLLLKDTSAELAAGSEPSWVEVTFGSHLEGALAPSYAAGSMGAAASMGGSLLPALGGGGALAVLGVIGVVGAAVAVGAGSGSDDDGDGDADSDSDSDSGDDLGLEINGMIWDGGKGAYEDGNWQVSGDTVAFFGSGAEPGSTVEIQWYYTDDDGNLVAGPPATATVDENGNWTSSAIDISGLPNNKPVAVYTRIVDENGNTVAFDNAGFQKVTTGTVPAKGDGERNGAFSIDGMEWEGGTGAFENGNWNVTGDSVSFYGSGGERGLRVEVEWHYTDADGSLVSGTVGATVKADGTWVVPDVDLSGIPDGTPVVIYARLVDPDDPGN